MAANAKGGFGHFNLAISKGSENMDGKYTDSDGRDYVFCPLIDDYIEDIECLENRAVVDRELIEKNMPEKYKKKQFWQSICADCQWHDY